MTNAAIHRLDKLTSGLLVMAKSMELTAKYQAEMKKNNVHKKYIARVSGKFEQGTFTIDKPLFCANPKQSRHAVALTPEELAKSKPASTTFTVIWYDDASDTSLLYCYPITGRTHQIRVHLQSVGHSIINDVNYGGRRVGNIWLDKLRDDGVITLGKRRKTSWSLNCGKELIDDNGLVIGEESKKVIVEQVQGNSIEQISVPTDIKKDLQKRSNESEKKESKTSPKELESAICEDVKQAQQCQGQSAKAANGEKQELKTEEGFDEDEDMRMFFNYGDDHNLPYTPFSEDRIMEIWLHSFEYSILGKTITTKEPYWTEKSIIHQAK